MIDMKDLRENPDKYRRGAELKNVKVDIDAILRLDEQWRSSQTEFERLRAEQNQKGKEIAALKDPEQKKAAVGAMAQHKARMKEEEERAESFDTGDAENHPSLAAPDLPSHDALAAEVERFLRDHGRGGD